MNTLGDVYRQTFSKKLRFDKACRMLHAEVYVIAKRHKHRKYIPKADVYNVLDRYEPLPGFRWLQLPVVRHVLFIRQINSLRCFFGKRSWLINPAVDEEFCRIKRWMASHEQLETKFPRGSSRSNFVQREQFLKEVVEPFHVATMYHRMLRLGIVLVIVLMLLALASVYVDALLYFYLVHWCSMRRKEVLEWFREITERHTLTEVPPAYKSLLPPPCILRIVAENSGGRYELRVTEFVSSNGKIVVMAIPIPQVGEKKFFTALGETVAFCDAVMMEGVPFERIDRIPPAALFPRLENSFPALGVHHRFLDIVRGKREPPFLYPASSELGWRAFLMQCVIPFEVRCVYWPTSFSASKGEARVGWGRLRELIEQVVTWQEADSNADAAPYIICLPWTVHQIVNLEASLIKYGFQAKRVFPVEWMDRDHMGEHFCDYFGIAE